MTFGFSHLRYPDLFPARIAGDWCGNASFQIDLPGGPYRVDGLAPSQHEAMTERYTSWRLPPDSSAAAVTIDVFSADQSAFIEPPGPSFEYEIDLDPLPGALRVAALHFMALVDLENDCRVGVWTSETEPKAFIGVIENVLRTLVAHRVRSSGGLLLHSSGIVIDGRCLLFVGHSGAGKSTIAGLALQRGHKVLSDDLNYVVRQGDAWVAGVMPFSGDHQGAAEESEFPVAALFRLEKGSENKLDSLSPADCFSLLVSSSPFVNTDPHRMHILEETIHSVVETLPLWRLTFRKDQSVWPIIEGL